MMNFSVVQEPSQARINDVRSRDEVIDFINGKKVSGWESDSVFHNSGRIDIVLTRVEGDKKKTYTGFAKPVEQ